MTYWIVKSRLKKNCKFAHKDIFKPITHVIFEDSSNIFRNNQWVPYLELRLLFKNTNALGSFLDWMPPDVINNLHYPTSYKSSPQNCSIPYCNVDCSNKIIIKFLLCILHKLNPLSPEAIANISVFLDLNLTNLNKISKSISDINSAKLTFIRLQVEQMRRDKLSHAAIFAQLKAMVLKSNDPEAFLSLGKYYEICEKNFPLALECYQEITEKMPRYHDVQIIMAKIMLQSRQAICPFEEEIKKLTAEELVEFNKQGEFHFKCLLNSKNVDYQPDIDRLFAQMSGEKMMEPSVTEIQADADTIIKLAKQRKIELEQTRVLKTENEDLKQKLAEASAAIKSLTAEKSNNEVEQPVVNKFGFF